MAGTLEGEIERWPGARGLRLLRAAQKGLETSAVPLVGQVSAGPLMVAEENIEGSGCGYPKRL